MAKPIRTSAAGQRLQQASGRGPMEQGVTTTFSSAVSRSTCPVAAASVNSPALLASWQLGE